MPIIPKGKGTVLCIVQKLKQNNSLPYTYDNLRRVYVHQCVLVLLVSPFLCESLIWRSLNWNWFNAAWVYKVRRYFKKYALCSRPFFLVLAIILLSYLSAIYDIVQIHWTLVHILYCCILHIFCSMNVGRITNLFQTFQRYVICVWMIRYHIIYYINLVVCFFLVVGNRMCLIRNQTN